MKLMLHRTSYEDDRTLGLLFVMDGNRHVDTFVTLEPPWNNNRRRVSCIPTGEYKVTPRYSTRFRHHLHVLDVPDRDWILFHVGNFPRDTTGCVLVGLGFADIAFDGKLEPASSRIAMNRLMSLIKKETELVIV